MDLFCLGEGLLRLAKALREYIAQIDPQDPGTDNREYQHAAFRQFVLWQYGHLGAGNRVDIPSCCVVYPRKISRPTEQLHRLHPKQTVKD